MPADIGERDVRSTKTEKALYVAMYSLLERRNFRKITASDICEEALISRATFYEHFTGKYDFLKWWALAAWRNNIASKDDAYEIKEQKINQYIIENKAIIRNLFMDADSWTLDTLFDVLDFILHLTTDKGTDGFMNLEHIVLSKFCIGGIIHYIMWQVKNDFPQNAKTMNTYFYEVIKAFQEWN